MAEGFEHLPKLVSKFPKLHQESALNRTAAAKICLSCELTSSKRNPLPSKDGDEIAAVY